MMLKSSYLPNPYIVPFRLALIAKATISTIAMTRIIKTIGTTAITTIDHKGRLESP